MDSHKGVLDFWFSELSPSDWWKKDDDIDDEIEKRFSALHAKARAGELWKWRVSAEGRLAEIIVLDQFSRNLFRNDPRSFAQDSTALVLAQECVRAGEDQKLSIEKRGFVYLPYMHSESLEIHAEALKLFDVPGLENNYEFEIKHLEILKRFGRYPHRNKVLKRQSSSEELEFLKSLGSSF